MYALNTKSKEALHQFIKTNKTKENKNLQAKLLTKIFA